MSLSIIYKVCCSTILKFVRVHAAFSIKSGQLMNVLTAWPYFTMGSESTEPLEISRDKHTASWILYPHRAHILSLPWYLKSYPLASPPLYSHFPNLPERDWGRWLRHQKLCLTLDQNSGLTGESLSPHRLPLHPHSRRFAIPSSSPAPLH